MRGRRLLLATALLLLATPAAVAQSPGSAPAAGESGSTPTPPTTSATPALPTVRLGALLPLTGPGAWFGKEMRQGMELAIAALNAPRPQIPRADRLDGVPGEDQKATAVAQRALARLLPAPGVTMVLEAVDLHPLDVKRARDEFARLAGLGAAVVFTASAGPALAIQPLAAARGILVIHQGAATARFAQGSRTLLHTRPSVDAQVDGLLAHVAGRRLRRLAVVAAGDEFGKAVRAAVSARSRERGGTVVAEESLTLDAPDLPARLRQLVRAGPEAIVLGFRGPELGEMAERLRAARYVGPLYLLDDDRSARLAGGVALQGAVIVTDAFVPELAAPSERFAEAYRAKFGETPSRYAAHAYDAVVMLSEGLRRSLADRRGIPGGSRLREALTVLGRVPSVYGDSVVLRDDGSLAAPLALFTVDGGDLAFVRYVGPADRS